tara:strand:+ start:2035 stop:2220 length:186 start_codon:yes stop_codon:yes gene_type:complete
MARTRNKNNINTLIVENAKLLQADHKAMKETLLQIHEALAGGSIIEQKEELLDKIQKVLKL